jgi:nicotinate-nucleotide adenylyltransferase
MWLLYPGTFDPVHAGHLALARDALAQSGAEGLVFLPAAHPPNKAGRTISPGAIRLELLVAAVALEDRMAVSDLDLRTPGPSYLVATLERIAADGAPPIPAGAELTILMSADTLADLPNWRQPQRILELARILVANRAEIPCPDPAWRADHFGANAGRIQELSRPDDGISSSEIRDRLRAGGTIDAWLPAPVLALIREHWLYLD